MPSNVNDNGIDKTRSFIVLSSGTMVSHYKIIEKIGAGGMGEVYLAEDTKLNRKVALKFLSPQLCQDEDCRTRFKREAQAAAALDHPNIVTIYEVREHQGRPFFAMQFVEGHSLQAYADNRDSSFEEIIKLAIGICEGLEEAHKTGIVHRDIKPSNILIDAKGYPKILDFGLATIKGSDQLTQTGSTLGTIGFMSPEQVQGKKVDQRSDLFSLGVVLYEMITGRPPFRENTEAATMNSIVHDTPEPLARYKTDVPDELQRIVTKALAKNLEERYQHAGDMAVDLNLLKKGVDGTSTATLPYSSVMPESGSGSKRKRFAIIFGVSIAALALATIIFILFPNRQISDDQDRVVVAIFENQTGDATLDHIGRMASDWITQGLSQTGLVIVLPVPPPAKRTEEFQNEDPIQVLAKRSGANIVVSGSYYLQDQKIQFHAQISDMQEEKLLRALDPVSGSVDDPLKIIESLRQRVMGVMAIIFDDDFRTAVVTLNQPPTYEAYREYMEGAVFFTRFDFRRALDHFYRSMRLDTTVKVQMLHAAVAHLNLGEWATADSLAGVVNEFREKLTPYQRHTLDWLKAFLRGDRVGALQASRRAASLAPGSPMHFQRGLDALMYNRPQETIDSYKMIDFETTWWKDWYPTWMVLASGHHMLGNFDEELEIARLGTEHFPDFLPAFWLELRPLAVLGKEKEIDDILDKSLTLPPHIFMTHGELMFRTGKELRAHGYREASLRVLERAIEWYKAKPEEEAEIMRGNLAEVLYVCERWDEAQARFDSLHHETPDNITYLGYLGLLAVRRGDTDEALRISKLLQDIKGPYLNGSNTTWLARIAALQGKKEQAMILLRDALAQGFSYDKLHADMNLESLYDYTPYKELIKPKG